MRVVNSYDIDGVIWLDEVHEGLRPGLEDVIVTGRSYQQERETISMLRGRGIHNFVFFNPLGRDDEEYGREASGRHKAKVFRHLWTMGTCVKIHFEDDPVQAKIIKKLYSGTRVTMIGDYGEWN